MSLHNRYSDLPQPRSAATGEAASQDAPAPAAAPQKAAAQPQGQRKPGVTNHAPYPVESKEHTRPLVATVSYVTDMVSDSLVRIYDGEVALRDEPFCVAREVVEEKTREQLRDYFALSFIPRLVCDARVPPGNTITACSLVNAAGQTVRIYFPRDFLELGNERELAPYGGSLGIIGEPNPKG